MPHRKALDEVFPGTRHQRCWVHKTANILNKLPKSMQPTVKADLREIWQADTRAAAEVAMDKKRVSRVIFSPISRINAATSRRWRGRR